MLIISRKQGSNTEHQSEYTLKGFYFVTRVNTTLLADFQNVDIVLHFRLFSSFLAQLSRRHTRRAYRIGLEPASVRVLTLSNMNISETTRSIAIKFNGVGGKARSDKNSGFDGNR